MLRTILIKNKKPACAGFLRCPRRGSGVGRAQLDALDQERHAEPGDEQRRQPQAGHTAQPADPVAEIRDRQRALEASRAKVAERLMAPDMFSGWGIRTLSSSSPAYNPMSYHNGSVWPHDNAIAVAGLMRYGFVTEAQRVARAVMDAGVVFAGRLPELFCGFDRAEFEQPVPYPTSCSPQAWAAASPLLLLRSLLRLEPDVPQGRLGLAPRQHSTGGRQRLDSISKMGERTIRLLLIIGGSSIVRQACRRGTRHSAAAR